MDESIERLTYFGESRVIELRNLDGYQHGDLVTINEKRAVIAPPQQQPVQSMYNPVMPQTVQKQPVAEGVSLDDIKGKQYSEVDTDYMYSNIDSSDESLADTLRKGKL